MESAADSEEEGDSEESEGEEEEEGRERDMSDDNNQNRAKENRNFFSLRSISMNTVHGPQPEGVPANTRHCACSMELSHWHGEVPGKVPIVPAFKCTGMGEVPG
ncbi:MAG: hypothetical protein MJE68_07960 [Proteobacteria bacterium]|nr:hypothetical protein [Pseudomonadota bacterium]